MIKALVFDFDGLILETEQPLYQSWQELYRANGLELPFEKWALNIGTAEEPFDPIADLESLPLFQPEIEKPRPGNLHGLAPLAHRQLLRDLQRQLSWVQLARLGQPHDDVRLVIAELGIRTGADQGGVSRGVRQHRLHGFAETFFKDAMEHGSGNRRSRSG